MSDFQSYLDKQNYNNYKTELSNLSSMILNDGFLRQCLKNQSNTIFCPYVYKPSSKTNSIDQNVKIGSPTDEEGKSLNLNTPQEQWSYNYAEPGKQIELYSDNIDQYVYLFGLPINLEKFNGVFLLKLAQMRFPPEIHLSKYSVKSIQYPFQGSVQFARLFCLYYALLTKIEGNIPEKFSYITKIFNQLTNITIDMVFDAFCMMFLKYHFILKYGQVSKIESKKIYYKIDIQHILKLLKYNTENIQEKQYSDDTTSDQLVYYFYKNYTKYVQYQALMFIKRLIQISDHINNEYISFDNNWGFVIPNKVIYYYNKYKREMNELLYNYFRTHNDNTSKYNINQINSINFYVMNGASVSDITVNQSNEITVSTDINNVIEVNDTNNNIETSTVQQLNTIIINNIISGKLNTDETTNYYIKISDTDYTQVTIKNNTDGTQTIDTQGLPELSESSYIIYIGENLYLNTGFIYQKDTNLIILNK